MPGVSTLGARTVVTLANVNEVVSFSFVSIPREGLFTFREGEAYFGLGVEEYTLKEMCIQVTRGDELATEATAWG